MKQRGQGSIVTIASINGMLGNPSNLAYCTSKGAVIQMVRSLASDLGAYGRAGQQHQPRLYPYAHDHHA
jgi:NAD(P)-dependent dehydrogenase (short-subunit alcohol dehydrogenase family)